MTISTICRRDVVTVDAAASLTEAALLMRERHVGALVVTVEHAGNEQIVGLLTDRDIAIEVIARGLDPADVRAGQLATRRLATVRDTASIAQAVAVMQEEGVRRLLVTQADGQLVGFVSTDDVLESLAAQFGGLAAALRSGLARERAARSTIAPPRPRPVFLAHGTPGIQQPVTGR